MKTLDMLYELNKDLNKQINSIKAYQNGLEKVVAEKKKVCWEEFYDKLIELSKYSKFLDSGFSINKCGETLGFEVRNGFIVVISWKHYDSNGRKLIEPETNIYAFSIKRDSPFIANGNISFWLKYLVEVIENWDFYLEETEKRLEERMIREMKKKIVNTESRQIELENELRKYA